MKRLRVDGSLGPLAVAEYVRLGVMPFQEFDEESQERINAECLEGYPPERERRFIGCSMMNRAYFEWYIRRGRDIRKARPKTTADVRARVAERDGWICGLCGNAIEAVADLHIDHIKPLSLGGKHVEGNLQATHAACNLAKGNRVVVAAESPATRANVASDSRATRESVACDSRATRVRLANHLADDDGATR